MTTNKYKFSEPSNEQVQLLCRDFIRSYGKGKEWDAMSARIALKDTWGIDLDWHELSYALDYMHRTQEAEITQPGGMTKYFIKNAF